MTGLTVVTGDASRPDQTGPVVIAHVCNDIGVWGRGFVLAVSRRWLLPEQRYRAWHHARATTGFGLGEVQFVRTEPQVWVANMIAQHGVRSSGRGVAPIRYEALRLCLDRTAAFAAQAGATLHMPRIGAGLAGGDWERIEPMIADALAAHAVAGHVYVLPDPTHRQHPHPPSGRRVEPRPQRPSTAHTPPGYVTGSGGSEE